MAAHRDNRGKSNRKGRVVVYATTIVAVSLASRAWPSVRFWQGGGLASLAPPTPTVFGCGAARNAHGLIMLLSRPASL